MKLAESLEQIDNISFIKYERSTQRITEYS